MRDHPVLLAVVPEALSREFFDEASRALLQDAAVALGGPAMLRVDSFPAETNLDEVQVLVTSWGLPQLGAELLDRMPSLGLVAHTGASIRSFVTDEVFARGIRVAGRAGHGTRRRGGFAGVHPDPPAPDSSHGPRDARGHLA